MTSPFPGRAQTLQYKKGWVKLVLCAQTYPPLSEYLAVFLLVMPD
jgi:hypothetical protein